MSRYVKIAPEVKWPKIADSPVVLRPFTIEVSVDTDAQEEDITAEVNRRHGWTPADTWADYPNKGDEAKVSGEEWLAARVEVEQSPIYADHYYPHVEVNVLYGEDTYYGRPKDMAAYFRRIADEIEAAAEALEAGRIDPGFTETIEIDVQDLAAA